MISTNYEGATSTTMAGCREFHDRALDNSLGIADRFSMSMTFNLANDGSLLSIGATCLLFASSLGGSYMAVMVGGFMAFFRPFILTGVLDFPFSNLRDLATLSARTSSFVWNEFADLACDKSTNSWSLL